LLQAILGVVHQFLRYARELVDDAKDRLRAGGRRVQYRDLAFAEVNYGLATFIFVAAEDHPL
jgi:hypothetical protein